MEALAGRGDPRTQAFITGGRGFLASHLAARLLEERGWRVTLLTRDPRRLRESPLVPRKATTKEGDLLSGKGSLIPEGADVICHLAAMTSVQGSLDDPRQTFVANARGTARLLEEIRKRDLEPRAVLVASSAHVYAPPFRGRIREDHPTGPRTPYAASKYAAESHALVYHALYGLPVSVVRFFNVYGPGQRPDLVVASVVSQCVEGQELRIGNPWPVRDFVFATDAADLCARMVKSPRAVGEVFNAGAGKGTSVESMARLAARVAGTGLKPKVDRSRMRRLDADSLVADPSKALQLLGWRATTSLEEGLRMTIEWYRHSGRG